MHENRKKNEFSEGRGPYRNTGAAVAEWIMVKFLLLEARGQGEVQIRSREINFFMPFSTPGKDFENRKKIEFSEGSSVKIWARL